MVAKIEDALVQLYRAHKEILEALEDFIKSEETISYMKEIKLDKSENTIKLDNPILVKFTNSETGRKIVSNFRNFLEKHTFYHIMAMQESYNEILFTLDKNIIPAIMITFNKVISPGDIEVDGMNILTHLITIIENHACNISNQWLKEFQVERYFK